MQTVSDCWIRRGGGACDTSGRDRNQPSLTDGLRCRPRLVLHRPLPSIYHTQPRAWRCRSSRESRDNDVDPQLVMGDMLLLWLNALGGEAIRASQQPEFEGWLTMPALPPGHFVHFMADTVSVMGTWGSLALLFSAYSTVSTATQMAWAVVGALCTSLPVLAAALQLSHQEYSSPQISAWVTGIAVVLVGWRGLVIANSLDE
mmetsp:Transcript_18825/g.52499  ORF Transcript_18825/g.52499 Transcript_18825/m.52499 type:complete len:202 (-) Transcript_18825:165-770(-)